MTERGNIQDLSGIRLHYKEGCSGKQEKDINYY